MKSSLTRALRLEHLRNKLAESGALNAFRKTYKTGLDEIPDRNTKSFWDRKTSSERLDLLESPIYKDKIKKITDYLKNKEGRLLDIGFGNAAIEQLLEVQNAKLLKWGIDLSPLAVELAKDAVSGNYEVGDLNNLRYKSHFFDFVLLLDVIEHIAPSEALKTYENISKVLSKDGIIIISVPLNEGLDRLVKRGKNPNAHLRIYTPSILKAELQLYGFNVFKEYYLFAFRNFYYLKTILIKLLPFEFRKPNLMIVFAKK